MSNSIFMNSLWRTRKAGGRKNPISLGGRPNMEASVSIPAHFRCPISLELMKDPVTVSTGITYDRQSIETWLDMGSKTCPVTNQALNNEHLMIPNHTIRRMIQDWCVANRSLGIERIPTPRIPVTPTEVLEILSETALASRRREHVRCAELVAKIKALAKENERNRQCIISNGASHVLSASFQNFAAQAISYVNHPTVISEILSALTVMFPLNEEACSYISSPESLHAIVWYLNCGDLVARLNAILVVKEILVHSDKGHMDAIAKTEGLIEALVKHIKEPISPQATKASLMAIFYLVTSNERIGSRFVELGLVDLLLEIVVDSENSMCEKALGVLDGICNCEMGRDKACDNALTIPLLVKKIFRVPDMATEFVISILWKLCKNYKKKEEVRVGCLVEALQVGAFQKLLLLLQVGCREATKDKASDLLKLMNGYRARLECIDPMDFKGLKRPF